LNEGISRSRRLNLKNPQEGLLGQLPQHTRDELMDVRCCIHYWFRFVCMDTLVDGTSVNYLFSQHWTAIQELLRHFWSSYPITSAVLYNKVYLPHRYQHCFVTHGVFSWIFLSRTRRRAAYHYIQKKMFSWKLVQTS